MIRKTLFCCAFNTLMLLVVNPANAQRSNDQGSVTISAGHGFLSPANWGFSTVFENLDVFPELNITGTLNYQNLGPYCLKGEYGINEKSGVGLNIAFISNRVNWEDNSTGYDYSVFRNNVAISGRYNYYFVRKPSFEFYGGLGFGVRVGGWGAESTDLTFIDLPNMPALIPLAFETTLGFRVYMVKGLAIYSEFGASKGFAQVGLAYKI